MSQLPLTLLIGFPLGGAFLFEVDALGTPHQSVGLVDQLLCHFVKRVAPHLASGTAAKFQVASRDTAPVYTRDQDNALWGFTTRVKEAGPQVAIFLILALL